MFRRQPEKESLSLPGGKRAMCRRPYRPRAFPLLLAAAFCCLAPTFAPADQTNPAGTVISGKTPGMQATVSNERVINLGGIVASSPDIAVGMGYPLGPLIYGVSLHNAGVIHATGGVAANGMYGPTNALVRNTGSISATGNVTANGIYGGDYSVLDNAGSITVSGGNAGGLTGQSHARLRNSGVISAAAAGGLASGMSALLDSSIINTGSITATALNGNAYGMFLQSGAAANYGLIRLSALNGRAHELVAQTGSVQVIDWAVDLRNFSNPSNRPFHATDGGKIDFTGARLILRPGAAAQGFVWGKEYAFTDMRDTYNGGSMAGDLASVTSELPELLEARLRRNSSGLQVVSLHVRAVNAHTNPGQTAAAQAVAGARARMAHVDSVLAGQLAPLDPAPGGIDPTAGAIGRWRAFGAPYVSRASNSKLEYSGHTVGFTAGATYRFHERFAAGLHLGYSGSGLSRDFMEMNNDASSGLLGLHAVLDFTPQWYLRGQFTGFTARYDTRYRGGMAVWPLYADADFNGHGLYAALHTGLAWRINTNHTLTPELGLAWLWTHQDAFGLRWRDGYGNGRPMYDMDYQAQNRQSLYGTAMLRWRGDFALGGTSLRPALGMGVRRTLGDNDVKSRLRFVDTDFTTRMTEDRSTALAEAGLEWRIGGFAAGLTYSGEYGSTQKTHTGWLTMKFEF